VGGRSPVGDWIASNAVTALWLTILTALSGVLAARVLGVVGRGELAAIQVWGTQLVPLALLGLGESLVYFTARQRDAISALTATAIVIGIAGSVMALGVGLLVIPWTLSLVSDRLVDGARQYLIAVPLLVAIGLIYCPLRAVGQFGTWNALRVIQTAMWPAVLLLAWVLGEADAVAVSHFYLGGLALFLLVIAIRVRREFPGPLRVSATRARDLLGFGLPALMATLPDAANSRLDQIFVAGSWGVEPLGLYAVASTWSSAYSTMFAALIHVVVPHVARLSNWEEQRAEFLRLWRLGVLLAVMMAIATAAIAPLAVPLLFGRQFARASGIAVLLCVPSLLLVLRQLLAAGSLGFGRPRALAQASTVALIVNLGLLAVTTPRSYVFGPALSAAVAHAAGAALLLHDIRSHLAAGLRGFVPTMADVAGLRALLRGWTGARSETGTIQDDK
jgi:O-antigen/teichoic acid export membrane protein